MRQALWMGTDATTRAAEDMTLFTEPERFGAIRYEALVALVDGQCAGFVEVSLRDDVDGFPEQTVGYVEGIFVEMKFRRGGIGETLLSAAEAWTRATGATDLVSEMLVDNPAGIAFHRGAGFTNAPAQPPVDKKRIALVRRLA